MKHITRFTLLATLAVLLPTGCARTSADKAGSETPTSANAGPENTDPGLEPLGDPVDQVGMKEYLPPTDGAAPNKPGTEDTGNPGGSTVNEVGSNPKK
ncbi:MAG TPA: hypothetical protein VGB85_31580 [Nannocystis sp.]